uniref:HOOK N-terminal domain-containing protein n=1 Tax=Pundamilia nyererei TaxID=303518 RepID=A0A3B4F0U3_9CICH
MTFVFFILRVRAVLLIKSETISSQSEAFMTMELVSEVRTLGPLGSGDGAGSDERLSMFMELVDGVFLHKIMTHIDPSPTNQRLNKNVNNDVSLRLHNLTVLTRHIRTYYQVHTHTHTHTLPCRKCVHWKLV